MCLIDTCAFHLQLAFVYECLLQLIVVPLSLSYVRSSCRPECLVGEFTPHVFALLRQVGPRLTLPSSSALLCDADAAFRFGIGDQIDSQGEDPQPLILATAEKAL